MIMPVSSLFFGIGSADRCATSGTPLCLLAAQIHMLRFKSPNFAEVALPSEPNNQFIPCIIDHEMDKKT